MFDLSLIVFFAINNASFFKNFISNNIFDRERKLAENYSHQNTKVIFFCNLILWQLNFIYKNLQIL